MQFDYEAARRDGFSDDQILSALESSGRFNYDFGAMRKDGFSSSDILGALFQQQKPTEAPKQEPSGFMRRVGDVGISALKGAISIPETAIGLADILTGGLAGKGAEAIGLRTADAKQALNQFYSPEQQAANRRVSEAKGFIDTAGTALTNPSTILQTAVESVPSMLAGGLVGRGVAAVAPRIGTLGAAAVGEGVVGAGQAAEQIRQAAPDRELSIGQSGAALASGIGTGIFGAVGGRIAQKLGIADIDTALVQSGLNTSTKGVARRLLEGGISEGVFEELPQSAQEQIWQNAALDKPLLDGVPEQAAQGMITGGLFGGVAGAVLRGSGQPAQEERKQPLLLTNDPDPLIAFPDGSVGRQSDVDAFINGLPEESRVEARARLFGYGEQPLTPEEQAANILRQQNIDDAIAVAERAIDEDTPEFKAQKNAEIDAAWKAFAEEANIRRSQEYAAAEQQRREADIPAMQAENQADQVAQAQALTSAQGFDEQPLNAMQLAMREAELRRIRTMGADYTRAQEQRAAQVEAERAAAFEQRAQEQSATRQQEFEQAQAARQNADAIAATIEGRQQEQALANSIAADVGMPQSQPNAMQQAFQQAQALRAQRLAEVRQRATVQAKQNEANNGLGNLGLEQGGRLYEPTGIQQQPTETNGNISPGSGVQNERQTLQTSAAEQSVDLARNSGVKQAGTGLPSAQASGSQPQVIDQAKAILSAAGVTGNERMEALRNIRSGVNTLEDLIDAHPPKQQGVTSENQNANAAVRPVPNVSMGGSQGTAPVQQTPTAGREAVTQRVQDGERVDTQAAGEPDGTRVSGTGEAVQQPAALKPEKPRKSEAPRGGMTATDVTKSLTPLRAKWLGFNRINTVQSISEIPADIQERAQPDDKTEAFYDPETKSVYMIADNISDPKRAAFVAAHETIGHGGLRMLRDKSVNEALNLASANRFIKELSEAISKDRATIRDSLMVEEAVAELSAAIETNDFDGLKSRYGVEIPNAARNGIRGVVARLYDAVKRFLATITGQPVAEISDADVRAMIGQQRAAVEGKAAPRQDAEKTQLEKPMQSRAPVAGVEQIPKWAEGMKPEVLEALRKSGAIFTEKTMRQKIDELRQGALQKLRTGILDQFAPIEEKLGRIPYVMARMAKNADGTLEALMLYGRPYLDSDEGMRVDTTKKGFIETMQNLQGEHERFFSWLAGKRAEQLKKEGRENLFTNDDISALATLNQGTMKDGTSREAAYLRAQKDVAELNNSVLDVAEASGLIDKESRKIWQSDFYVPFYRVMEEGVTGPSIKSGLVNQKSIKKLKGGTNNLNDLTENMLRNWSTLLTASAKNRAARASLQQAVNIGIATEADETTIRQMGKAANTKAVSYMDEGKNRWHVVEDDDVLAAISALEFNGYNNHAMKVMQKFKNWLTFAVTTMPGFKVRNLIRDSIQAIAVSDLGYNPFTNLRQGASLLGDKDLRAQMVAGGGIYRFGTMMEGDRGSNVKRLIDAGVHPDNILDTAEKMKAFLTKLWDRYQEIGDIGENINRAALYKKLRDEGKSHLEASYEARDLMDFGLSGAWAGVRALNQILPFFNARLQGLYKLGRGYNDDPKKLGTVVAATLMVGLASLLAYKDDEDFKKRTDADRANFWWFKIGDTAVRIPKPFEVGAAATAVENLLALGLDSENTNIKRFYDQTKELINGQLAMNFVPQIVRPLNEIYANKNSFGKPIESAALQRLRPEDRYTYNTSELARLLSKSGLIVEPIGFISGTGAKQLSPVQIDHLIRGYFSGMGTLATAAVDGLLHHSVIDRGEALPATLKTFAGSFAETLPTNNSRYVDMLYTSAQHIEQTYASYRNALKNGDIEKARAIMREERATIAKYHLVESLKKNETRINQQIQRVLNDKEMSGKDKQTTINRLRQEQDRIARAFAKQE